VGMLSSRAVTGPSVGITNWEGVSCWTCSSKAVQQHYIVSNW
jgi:hypothetical protein